MSVRLNETDVIAPGRNWPSGLLLPEIALAFLGLLALVELSGLGRAVLDARPHIFWIPVLLFASYGGLRPGIIAAVTASGLHWFLSNDALPIGFDFYDYLHAVVKEPALWIGTAAAIGAIRDRDGELFAETRRMADSYKTQRKTIAEYAFTLRDHIRELEQDRAFRADNSMAEFRTAISQMSTASGHLARYGHLRRACQIATNCEAANLLRRTRQSWRPIQGGRSAVDVDERLSAALDKLSAPQILQEADGDRPGRIAIPVTVAQNSCVLLLDGCAADNDAESAAAICGFIASQWARGKTVTSPATAGQTSRY